MTPKDSDVKLKEHVIYFPVHLVVPVPEIILKVGGAKAKENEYCLMDLLLHVV